MKYPKYEHLEDVLDLIDEKNFCTRGEIAERSRVRKTQAKYSVDFLSDHRLIEEKTVKSGGASGRKGRKIYSKYNRCILIIDLSSCVWRCVALSLCKKITPLVEYEYSFDMDFFDNLDIFLSNSEYIKKCARVPHVMFSVVLLPSSKRNKDFTMDIEYRFFKYPYPGARPILERVKRFTGKRSLIPMTYETAAEYCVPSECGGAYISVSNDGVKAFFGNSSDTVRAAQSVRSFGDSWNKSKGSADRTNTAIKLFCEMGQEGFSKVLVDFDSINVGLEAKIRKEIEKIICKDEKDIMFAVNYGNHKAIYIEILRLSLRMYVSALIKSSDGKEKSDKKQVFRVRSGIKRTDK